MDTEHSGLTLEGLAERLEALERENAELRSKVVALEGSETSEDLGEGTISRRRLLGKVGAAAAGLVVAGALTQRDIRQARAAGESPPEAFLSNTTTPAVSGLNTFGNIGVYGKGLPGIQGETDGATGQGVYGRNSTAGDGVLGDSQGGAAIRGRSFDSTGVGVHGEHFGSGYGGQFKGGKAQLKLVPSGRTGRPRGSAPHSKGELYMDSNAALFVCVRGGSPGKWRKISTTTV